MNMTRINLDSVAWPLWVLAISHLIISIVMAVAMVQAQIAIQGVGDAMEEMQKDLRKMD